MPGARLNLTDITRRVGALRGEFASGCTKQAQDVGRRLVAGYAFVDELLATGVDLFEHGHSAQLLELNHIILCGVSTERRAQFAAHLAATTAAFYADEAGALRELADWLGRGRGYLPERLAAGAFIRIASAPQLFIEGNMRTATLFATYVLARAHCPPLVLTPRTFRPFLKLEDEVRVLDRRRWSFHLRAPLVARRIERFLANHADPALLRPAPGRAAE